MLNCWQKEKGMKDMIFLEANIELKRTFERLIQTMEVPVKWNHLFVILNNFLILPGDVRSLVFNFDNRKVNTNVIEIPIVEEAIQPIDENVLVTNVLDMILYAFGKWGTIKGIRVEKDYAQLNALFTEILREIKVEPGYRNDNFRFYQDGIQITYEDVVQKALEAEAKRKEELEEEQEEEKLGLWHNMKWVTAKMSFKKEEPSQTAQESERIGNNFYMVGYQCPNCGKNLHMVVYPVDKEFLVETEEGRVYLARAYACDVCNRFYTPRPGKLLSESDVYLLEFGEDRDAYEDYQELLGAQGEKTSNYKFNEYEWERNKKRSEEDSREESEKPEEEESEETENIEESENIQALEQRKEEGAGKKTKEKSKKKNKENVLKKESAHEVGKKGEGLGKEADVSKEKSVKLSKENLQQTEEKKYQKGKNGEEKSEKEKQLERQGKRETKVERGDKTERKVVEKGETAEERETVVKTEYERESDIAVQNEQEVKKARQKYDARMNVIDRMSLRQLKELLGKVRGEKLLLESDKQEYIQKLETHIQKSQKAELEKRADNGRKGNYAQLCRSIEEIERSDSPAEMKKTILAPLYELRNRKAQEEADALLANMPINMDRKRYKLFWEKLAQYKEADIAPYEQKLEEQKQQAERQEIASMVNRVNKNDRGAIFHIWQRLQSPDFSRENTEKPLQELHDRIQKLDEAAIDRICPKLTSMTFEEGQEAYEKIEKGMFLPEIKSNALEMIDKRLTKIKSDESELLVQKLKSELSEKLKDTSSLHYYAARKAMRGEWEGEEAMLVNCALKTYASEHSRYEFPIVVCDSTHKGNGREGFLLTPDYLYYNSTFSSERVSILNIKEVSFSTGLLNKGIYIQQKNGQKTKIPVGVPSKEWKEFTDILEEFVKYLQEKPESRKVSYLAKEEHEVKCCYRCGYVYKGGDVCPKCGSRANR